jgi:X breakpoint 2-interacting protein
MGISNADGAYMGSYDVTYTSGDDAFADIHNLDHCIKYLNQSLVTFGFPSALNLYSSEPVRSVLYSQFFFQLPS